MLRLTPPQKPHIIVLGNVKGGSGKSTLSMHVAIGLLQAGRRVATLDLDFDQQSLTRYVNNRRVFAADNELVLDIPTHYRFEEGPTGTKAHSSETIRLNFVSKAIAAAEPDNDFIIIDTPSGVNKTNLFAHALADTVITPINDSFLDLDVIAAPKEVPKDTAPTPYAETIRQAREARRLVTPRITDWLVLRNRISSLETRNERAIRKAIEEAGERVGFRTARGLTERVIYREFFPKGLTAFDSMEASLLGVQPALSHVLAREEVRQLISMVQVSPSEKSERWTRYPRTLVHAPAA
jgi:chromosome partitioning protein